MAVVAAAGLEHLFVFVVVVVAECVAAAAIVVADSAAVVWPRRSHGSVTRVSAAGCAAVGLVVGSIAVVVVDAAEELLHSAWLDASFIIVNKTITNSRI